MMGEEKPRQKESERFCVEPESALNEGGKAKLMRMVEALRSPPCTDLRNSKFTGGARTYGEVALLGLLALRGDNRLGRRWRSGNPRMNEGKTRDADYMVGGRRNYGSGLKRTWGVDGV